LLLDEATSALDKKTERTILASLKEFKGTLIFATHHHEVLRVVDTVVVLERGRVARVASSKSILGAGMGI
jgi:ATP-binding cassette subfamily C protein LapB